MNTGFIVEKKDYNNYRRIIENNYKEMMGGLVSEIEAVGYITEAISAIEPCKNDPNAWFWMFEEPSNMPSDCRVDFVYETTYMNTAIIMYSLARYESVRNISGLMETLSKVLVGCMGRGFMGHGFENIAGFINAMRIFARAGIKTFLETYSEHFCDFARFFEDRMNLLEKLAEDKVRDDWGYSYKEPASAILELLSYDRCPIRLFVYGTLMRGQRAHHYLEDAKYLGEYILDGYSMYDLGSFPGIVRDGIDRRVIGEVYEITPEMIPFMDNYEGEGNLYIREEKCVHNENECLYANAYIYNSEPVGKRVEGKWGKNDMDYVWYACYGSNLSSDRFRCYIEGGFCAENGREYEGCSTDKSLWIDSKVKAFPGKLHFANNSGSWDGKGVAFYDPDSEGETIMRLYKITKDQLLEVQRQEGSSLRWYGNMLELGTDDDGCKIFTLTNSVPVPGNAPSDSYINLIKKALIEECSVNPEEVEKYLSKSLVS